MPLTKDDQIVWFMQRIEFLETQWAMALARANAAEEELRTRKKAHSDSQMRSYLNQKGINSESDLNQKEESGSDGSLSLPLEPPYSPSFPPKEETPPKSPLTGDQKGSTENDDWKEVFEEYRSRIQPKAKPIDLARDKIRTRMRSWSRDELFEAIHRFSGDKWQMDHNSWRGAAWFFHSDARIEQFRNLERKVETNGKVPFHDIPEHINAEIMAMAKAHSV